MNIPIFRCLMMMVSFFVGVSTDTNAQNTIITLKYCQNEAFANYPLAKDKALIQATLALKIASVQTGLLPQLSLNGQATYQSDAINISLPTQAGLKTMSSAKDQYKATLDINQMVYDGGTNKYQRKLEESSAAADVQQVEVDIYKIREQVNNAYFLLLSLQENRKLLNTTLSDIQERKGVVASSVQNGLLTPTDLDVLEAERLKVEQLLAEIDISKKSTINILSILISKPVSDSAKFELPVVYVKDTTLLGRPEYKLFELQTKRLDDSKQLTGSLLMPKVNAFVQGGYGRPGLNMLSTNFETYYMLGANFKWTLWDWSKNRKDRQVLDVQKKMVQDKREAFEMNLNIDLQNRLSSIQKLEEALKRDDQIVELRSRITKTSASRLENGVITPTDYLTDLNAETTARINLETHKIQLVQTKANYILAKGNY
jgi:outer membrane protein TolC